MIFTRSLAQDGKLSDVVNSFDNIQMTTKKHVVQT